MSRYILYCLIFWAGFSFAQSTNRQELAKIKAQAIYNFVNYIEWPNMDQIKEFRVGLLGADQDMVNAMNNIAATKLVMQLPMKIIPFGEFSDVKKLPQTEILYVNAANYKNFDLSKIKKNVLVISYNEPDIYRSMISFMVVDNKLKFAFNAYLTKKAGFYIHEDFKSQAAVYIENPDQTKKNQQAQEQWGSNFEKTNSQDLAKTKAQSIYNFVNYIEWPNIDQAKEFKIGLLGADPELVDALNNMASNKMIMRLPMKVITFNESSDVKKLPQTEILYVDAANFKNFDVTKVKKGVLVVSYNQPDLFRSMISFVVVDNKLQFAFNSYLTQKADLDIHDDFKTQAAVYIEDPNQTKKNQQAQEKWESAVEKIVGKLQKGDENVLLSNTELLEVAEKISEQEKNITEQQKKISTQLATFKTQEDSLERQRKKLGLAIAQNKMQEANLMDQKERIDNQLNAILSQEQRAQLQEEKLNLTIAQNKLQESELSLKKEELNIQEQRIKSQNDILEAQKVNIRAQESRLIKQLEKINSQQTILWLALIAGFAVVACFSLVYRNYKKTKKTNALLENQKFVIEAKHKEITDSIYYAERIQKSFLASKELLDEHLKEYFIFFQPKDVVSGDFYWASKLNNGKFALVTADSTGHGVPGAIMSLLNITSLERAIEGQSKPAEILNDTRKIITNRLKNDGSKDGGRDGMDCTFLSFNFENNKLEYAAANNPLWIVRKNEILEFAPDKMPVGRHELDNVPFEQKTISLEKGDTIYAITDGMPDQFGGPKGKKFMYKRLKELLISISHLSMDEQKDRIKKALDDWMGANEQVDDITLVGVRV